MPRSHVPRVPIVGRGARAFAHIGGGDKSPEARVLISSIRAMSFNTFNKSLSRTYSKDNVTTASENSYDSILAIGDSLGKVVGVHITKIIRCTVTRSRKCS